MIEIHPLLRYAEESGRSMREIANQARCSRTTLYRLTKGEQNATIDLLTRVSAATEGVVPVSAFIAAEAQP